MSLRERTHFLTSLILAVCFAFSSTIAQTTPPPPAFKEFPASAAFKGKPAHIKLDTKAKRMYRTVLRDGAKRGPNFAGHYTVVVWGCGSQCQTVAVIDAKNGTVLIPDLNAEFGVQFRRDSRLLIVNEPEYVSAAYGKDLPEWQGTDYYVWEDGHFTLIYTTRKKTNQ